MSICNLKIIPIDLLWQAPSNTNFRGLASPSSIEMLLHSTHIGCKCTKQRHKLQTKPHSTTTLPNVGKSALAVPVRRGVSVPFPNCTRRLEQSGVLSATRFTMETVDAKTRIKQLDTTDRIQWEEDQELVDLAIVWALQHGLVSRLFMPASLQLPDGWQ